MLSSVTGCQSARGVPIVGLLQNFIFSGKFSESLRMGDAVRNATHGLFCWIGSSRNPFHAVCDKALPLRAAKNAFKPSPPPKSAFIKAAIGAPLSRGGEISRDINHSSLAFMPWQIVTFLLLVFAYRLVFPTAAATWSISDIHWSHLRKRNKYRKNCGKRSIIGRTFLVYDRTRDAVVWRSRMEIPWGSRARSKTRLPNTWIAFQRHMKEPSITIAITPKDRVRLM